MSYPSKAVRDQMSIKELKQLDIVTNEYIYNKDGRTLVAIGIGMGYKNAKRLAASILHKKLDDVILVSGDESKIKDTYASERAQCWYSKGSEKHKYLYSAKPAQTISSDVPSYNFVFARKPIRSVT